MHYILALLLAATYNEKLDVRLHSVDVIVTDAKGNHAGGLTADDFEIFENGVPQTVSNFAEYAERSATAQTPPPRRFAIFIDEMTLHPVSRKRLGESINELLDRSLREGDEVMVVRPTTGEQVVLPLTSDRAAIRRAIDEAMEESKLDLLSDRAAEDRKVCLLTSGMSQWRARQTFAEHDRLRIEQRLGAIRATVAGLSELPGRKIVIAVMEALPAQPGREVFGAVAHVEKATSDKPGNYAHADYVDLTAEFQDLARTASANGITIYGLQPEFVSPGAPDSAEGFQKLNLGALTNTEDGMNVLTRLTGGKWYRGDTRADDAMRQVALDVGSYYSLAYHTHGKLETALHVDVRVRNHPELRMRTRTETISKTPLRELTDRVVSSLVAASPRNDLGIGVRSSETKRKGNTVSATIDVAIPIEKLSFVEENGMHRARFTVHYAISGNRLDFVSGVDPEQLVEIPDAQWDSARSKQWTHSLHFNTSLGPHRLAVGVLDSSSMTWGINALTIDAK